MLVSIREEQEQCAKKCIERLKKGATADDVA
jgi:hypothetical protein